MTLIKNFLLILLIAIVVTLSVQNMAAFGTSVHFRFLNSTPIAMPFVFWVALAFALGYCLSFMFALKKAMKDKSERKKLKKEIESLEKELIEHRNRFLETETDSSEVKPIEPT